MRDFFYNKSDVLIAILIILIAAFVIYTRVGVIMDYPSKAAGGEGTGYLPGIQDVLTGSEDADTDADKDEAAFSEDAPDADVPADEPVTPPSEDVPDETVTPPDPPVPPESTTEVSITVSAGDVGSTIADKLVAAGAITDKAAFLAEVATQHADTKLKQGTFKIPAGSTLSDIVKILVG